MVTVVDIAFVCLQITWLLKSHCRIVDSSGACGLHGTCEYIMHFASLQVEHAIYKTCTYGAKTGVRLAVDQGTLLEAH